MRQEQKREMMYIGKFHAYKRAGNTDRFRQHSQKISTHVADPKEFSDVYKNPLDSFLPLLTYFTNLPFETSTRKPNYRHKEEDLREDESRRWMRGRDQSWERMEEEQEERESGQELRRILSHCDKHTFESWKQQIKRQFSRYREKMNKGRKDNLNFIQKDLRVPLDQPELLNDYKLDQNWKRIQGILSKKIEVAQDSFNKKLPLIKKLSAFDQVLRNVFKEKQELRSIQNQKIELLTAIFEVVATYCALPTTESLHGQIIKLSTGSQQVMRQLSREEDEMCVVLHNLKWKESSFYWNKIIDCCRNISECDHYNELENRRVDNFEAEYAGMVTQETLKKLKDRGWLDNCITSAVVEYLKQVQGGNNYHGDDNRQNFLFNHSQTDIFINSPRDVEQSILSYSKLIFLVNYDNIHWFVIVVYNQTNQVVVHDSLGSYPNVYDDYCQKIINKLNHRKGSNDEYKIIKYYTPKQNNQADCGVFSIVNILCVFDKDKDAKQTNYFNPDIIGEIRNSLFLFLLYLGYCKRFQVVPRKDYFDILFRCTINHNIRSKLHHFKQSKT